MVPSVIVSPYPLSLPPPSIAILLPLTPWLKTIFYRMPIVDPGMNWTPYVYSDDIVDAFPTISYVNSFLWTMATLVAAFAYSSSFCWGCLYCSPLLAGSDRCSRSSGPLIPTPPCD